MPVSEFFTAEVQKGGVTNNWHILIELKTYAQVNISYQKLFKSIYYFDLKVLD